MHPISIILGIFFSSLAGFVIFSDYITEKKKENKRKYYYDEKTAMLRKKMI